jgi:hypothetical protein
MQTLRLICVESALLKLIVVFLQIKVEEPEPVEVIGRQCVCHMKDSIGGPVVPFTNHTLSRLCTFIECWKEFSGEELSIAKNFDIKEARNNGYHMDCYHHFTDKYVMEKMLKAKIEKVLSVTGNAQYFEVNSCQIPNANKSAATDLAQTCEDSCMELQCQKPELLDVTTNQTSQPTATSSSEKQGSHQPAIDTREIVSTEESVVACENNPSFDSRDFIDRRSRLRHSVKPPSVTNRAVCGICLRSDGVGLKCYEPVVRCSSDNSALFAEAERKKEDRKSVV